MENYKQHCSYGLVTIALSNDRLIDQKDNTILSTCYQQPDKNIANARLAAEAFNVLNTTGLTPQELVEQVKVLREALQNIAEWNLPETGEFWDEAKTRKISYEHNYGSNGARDYMRTIAQQALETTELKP